MKVRRFGSSCGRDRRVKLETNGLLVVSIYLLFALYGQKLLVKSIGTPARGFLG